MMEANNEAMKELTITNGIQASEQPGERGILGLIFASDLLDIEEEMARLQKKHERVSYLRDCAIGNQLVNFDPAKYPRD